MAIPTVPPIPEAEHTTTITVERIHASFEDSFDWSVVCDQCGYLYMENYGAFEKYAHDGDGPAPPSAIRAKDAHDRFAGRGITVAEIMNDTRPREEFLQMIEADDSHCNYAAIALAWGQDRGQMSDLEALIFISEIDRRIELPRPLVFTEGTVTVHGPTIRTSDVVRWFLKREALEMMQALVDDIHDCATCEGPCQQEGQSR